jgi:hypothetical protein
MITMVNLRFGQDDGFLQISTGLRMTVTGTMVVVDWGASDGGGGEI